MINTVGNESNRPISKGKLNSTGMRASKSAHIVPACRYAAGNTGRKTTPVPIDLYSGNCPVAVARPCGTVAIHRRGFANQKCVTGTIRDFLDLDTSPRVRRSPKDAEAIARIVTIHLSTGCRVLWPAA